MEKREELIENIGVSFIGGGLIGLYLCAIISTKILIIAAPSLSIGGFIILRKKLRMNNRFLVFSFILSTLGGIASNVNGYEIVGILTLISLASTYIIRAVKYEII